MKNNSLVYTVEEAAGILGIGLNQAYQGVHSGQIPSIRIGRSIKIPKPAIDTLLEKPVVLPEIKEQVEIEEIKKVPRLYKPPERRVGINVQISVLLNNKLVESAISRGVTMSQEIRDRLSGSFEQEEK